MTWGPWHGNAGTKSAKARRTRPGALEASLRAFLGGERDDDPHFDERRVLADYARAKGEHLLEGCDE